MKRFVIPTLISLAVMASTPALADGNIQAGKEKSQTCTACHGKEGNAPDPQYPRLAGQWESYLLHSLKAYKSGQRSDPIMQGFVSTLSEQDMQDLAAYYASLPGKLDDLSGHVQGD